MRPRQRYTPASVCCNDCRHSVPVTDRFCDVQGNPIMNTCSSGHLPEGWEMEMLKHRHHCQYFTKK